MTTKDVTLVVRCRPFRCEGVQKVRVLVEADGNVLVWDDAARHYTRLHALSPHATQRIRRLAAARAAQCREVYGGSHNEAP